MELHLATVFESVADAAPDATAIIQGGVRRSWSQFDSRATRLAGSFLAAGLGVGSKVAEYLYNSPEYLEAYYAALKIRAVPVNVNYRYMDDELLYLLDNSDAEVLVFHSSLGDRVARVRDRAVRLKLLVEVDDGGDHIDGAVSYDELLAEGVAAPRIERDPADITMIYTGGTTGMPKGVMTRIGPGLETVMQSTPALVGLPPLTDPAEIAPLVARLAAASVPMRDLKEGVLEKIGSTKTPQPVLGVAAIPTPPDLDAVPAGLVVVAVGVADPGNLGTIIRSAEAAGAVAIVTGDGVDPWNPKVVRGSAGAVLGVPIVTVADVSAALATLRTRGWRAVGAAAEATEDYTTAPLSGSVAIVLGSEAHGLPAEVTAVLDASVRIPMTGAIESLNVAVAASILMFEAARQSRSFGDHAS